MPMPYAVPPQYHEKATNKLRKRLGVDGITMQYKTAIRYNKNGEYAGFLPLVPPDNMDYEKNKGLLAYSLESLLA